MTPRHRDNPDERDRFVGKRTEDARKHDATGRKDEDATPDNAPPIPDGVEGYHLGGRGKE